MKRRIGLVMLLILCLAMQSTFACIIFGVGKAATADGSTMTSHTCDSNGDDLRLFLIGSMAEGTEREIVVDGRKGADFTGYQGTGVYGERGMALGSYTNDKDTYQYLHAMYSFANEKGLTMTESTCGWTTEQRKVFAAYEGIWDCYQLQDAALENCATAKEAVEFMLNKVETEGWNGWPESMTIADGTDLWCAEFYGGNVAVAFRVPDDALIVIANRCRINFWEENSDTYLSTKGVKDFAIQEGLWDGQGDFNPCKTFAAGNYSFNCIGREWRTFTMLSQEWAEKLADEDLAVCETPDETFPLYITPDEKVSVNTLRDLCMDTYANTKYDSRESAYAGPFGNVLTGNYERRGTMVPQCTYFQCSNVKAWLPEEVRCLVWFGYGATLTQYMTPVFASATCLDPKMSIGTRDEGWNPNSGWWNQEQVQTAAMLNCDDALQVISAVREPLMTEQFETTFAIQNVAANMVNNGNRDAAIALLTTYQNGQFNMWFDLYADLAHELLARYANGRINFQAVKATNPEWWNKVVDAANAARTGAQAEVVRVDL